MDKKAVNTIKYLLSLLLAAVLVYFAFRKVDWGAFLGGLRETSWGYFIIFIAASVVALVFREERWRAMMLTLDSGVRRLDAWDSANIGNMVNVVLPGAGEFVRCGYISSKRMGYDKALGTIVSERAWDILAVGLLFIIALSLKWNSFGAFFIENIWLPLTGSTTVSLWWVAVPVAIAALLVWVVYRFRNSSGVCRKAVSAVAGLWRGISSFTGVRNKWGFVLYTVGIWAMYTLMTYSVLLSVPALSHLSPVDALFISSVGNIASVIPVPGGIGAYHYLVALCLQSLYGADWDTGILAATLNHELHAVVVIVLGIFSYFALGARRRRA